MFFTVTCDTCGEKLCLGDHDFSVFDSIKEAKSKAETCDWVVITVDTIICDNCFEELPEEQRNKTLALVGKIFEKGDWVLYDEKEKGRVKSWNDEWIFVVFNCADQWDDYENYTAAACDRNKLIRCDGIE